MATEQVGTKTYIERSLTPERTPAQAVTDFEYQLKDHGCGPEFLGCPNYTALRMGAECGAVFAQGTCKNKKPSKI